MILLIVAFLILVIIILIVLINKQNCEKMVLPARKKKYQETYYVDEQEPSQVQTQTPHTQHTQTQPQQVRQPREQRITRTIITPPPFDINFPMQEADEHELLDVENQIARGLGQMLLGAIFNQVGPVERLQPTDAAEMRNDPQNAHDSQLLKGLRNELELIIQKNKSITKKFTLDDIRDYALNSEDRDVRDRAMEIIDVLDTVEENQLISTFNMGERDILIEVWKRAEHPENEKVADNIRDAICNAIYDSKNGNATHCITGRATRFINALSGIDTSEDLGKASTGDFYRSEIYKMARDIHSAAIAEAEKSNDPDIAAIARSYEDTHIIVDPKKEEEFIRSIKSEIEQKLDEHYGKMKISQYAKYKADALAGID